MNIYRRHLSVGLLALAAGGISWVSASGEVVLYPATIEFTAVWPAELTVTSTALRAYPVLGGSEISKSVPAGQPLALTVDGGNPDLEDNPGVDYRLRVVSVFQVTPSQSASFDVTRYAPVNIQNTGDNRSATVQSLFNPSVVRPTIRIDVTGSNATLSSYSVHSTAGNSAAGESYMGYASGNPAAGATSLQAWVPAPARAGVEIYGSATVLVNGVPSTRSLPARTIDLTTPNDPAPWTIDINNDTTVTGDILVANLGAATPTYQVYYRGADSTTSGISGYVSVSAGTPPMYSFDVPHGSFKTYLRASFSSPSRSFTTPELTKLYQPGVVNDPFVLTLGQGAVTVSVGGFYGLGDLYSARSDLHGGISASAAYSGSAAGMFLHTVPVGVWSASSTVLRIRDLTDPLLPNVSTIDRTYYEAGEFSPQPVAATGVADLGTQSFTLVRSTLYFDVVEPRAPGAPAPEPIKLSSPQISATKYDLNPDGSWRRRTLVWATGSSEPRDISGLVMAAEPGRYDLLAQAYVNNTLTNFSGTTITFGDLVASPPSGNGQIPLSDTPDLQITLDVTGAGQGSTAFVETPLGPAPPAGFQMSCSAPPGEELPPELSCPNTYYDINSTTTWESATVCMRKKFSRPLTEANAASEFLTLWRYVNGDWKELDDIVRTDCSGDPVACGCTSGECDIPDGTFLFKVCGSYSPEAGALAAQLGATSTSTSTSTLAGSGHSALLLAGFKPIELTNVVDGVEHTGPTGPVQSWVVPGDATYRITAVGAQGAAATNATGRQGGCGTEVAGDFALAQGDVIQIIVGQAGTAAPSSGGGGGGSFVVRNGVPLLVAGGGGGVRSGATVDGRPGSLTADGTAGSTSAAYTSGFVAGGTGGAGGARASSYGSGGGGWSGNGAGDGTYGEGGFSFLGAKQAQGGLGKGCGAFAHGGFGGGAAGNGCYGGGGGGGYSGGGGGRVGGGGGSWNAGANPASRQPPACEPHGRVAIELR